MADAIDARLVNLIANQTKRTPYLVDGKELKEIRFKDVQNIHMILQELQPQMIGQGAKQWQITRVYDTNNPREKFRSDPFTPVHEQYNLQERDDYYTEQIDKPIIEYRIMYFR